MRFFRPPRTLTSGHFSFWLSWPQLITWGSVFYTFSLLMTPLEAELGMSRAESSLAFSLALLAEGAMAYAVGRWIDAGHERRVMTLGSIWVGLGLLGHSSVTSVMGFYAAWIWLGLGLAATLYTPAFAVVTRRFPQDFRRAIITLTFLGGLASTVFIPLFAWWMELWGWRQALVAVAALQLLGCAPLHAWLLRGAHGRQAGLTALNASTATGAMYSTNSMSSTNATYATEATGATESTVGKGKAVASNAISAPDSAPWPESGSEPHPAIGSEPARESVGVHLRQRPFWLLAVFMVLMMAVTSALPAHMIALLQESGLSPVWVIAIPAAIGVIQVVGRGVLFVFERYWNVHTANRWIPGFIPLGLLALLVGGFHPTGALVFVLLYGLGNGMLTIVKGTALAQYVSRDHVGQLNGLLGMPIALARAAAPLCVGLLWSPTAGYQMALLGLLVASLLATAALWAAQHQALQSPQARP
jgi:MFS family permease